MDFPWNQPSSDKGVLPRLRTTPHKKRGKPISCRWLSFLNNQPSVAYQHLPRVSTAWWFGTWILFVHSVGDVIIPTDFQSIIFQRGRYTNHQPVKSITSFTWPGHFRVDVARQVSLPGPARAAAAGPSSSWPMAAPWLGVLTGWLRGESYD